MRLGVLFYVLLFSGYLIKLVSNGTCDILNDLKGLQGDGVGVVESHGFPSNSWRLFFKDKSSQ